MTVMFINAFTCTGPYAILILCGIKRTENRSAWPEPREGRAAISCSRSFCKEEYWQFIAWASVNLPPEDFEKLPAWREVKDWPGKVIGVCDYKARARGTHAVAAVAGRPPCRADLFSDAGKGGPCEAWGEDWNKAIYLMLNLAKTPEELESRLSSVVDSARRTAWSIKNRKGWNVSCSSTPNM